MYHFRKEKEKVVDRLVNWREQINNIVLSMFKYEGYNGLDPFRFWNTFEDLLTTYGRCAVIKNGENLFAGRVTFEGLRDEYGDLSNAIVYSEHGKQWEFEDWRENENIVIVHNNLVEWGESEEIERFCSILADIDKSIKHNVIFTRYNPTPIVSDENEKKELEEVFANNENGKLGCMVSDNIGLGDNDTIKMLNLTDVANANKIQYLNKCHDDIVKRLCTWVLGINVNTNTSKMAQQSVEEITSGEKLSQCLPLIKLYCRMLGVDEINKKFGYNITVTFGETWDAILKKEEEDNPKEPTEEPTEAGKEKTENENED